MTPLPFVWPYALVFWAAFAWAYFPESRIVRNAQRDKTATDGKSIQVIVYGGGIATFAAFAIAWTPAFQFATHRVAIFFSGVAVLIAASWLRRHCFRMLGASFTGDVRARADQQIVTRGAYTFLRHPSYTAGILLNTGMGIALGSWASAILLTVAAFVVYSYRIAVEERALLSAIGEPYRVFMNTRKRLIPFVY